MFDKEEGIIEHNTSVGEYLSSIDVNCWLIYAITIDGII